MDTITANFKHFTLRHQLKRRVRIETPVLKNDPERCYVFEILLQKRPEIKRVRSTIALGSVIVEFDPRGLSKAHLLSLLDTVLGNLAHKPAARMRNNKADFPERLPEIELAVEGMTCASCALLLEMVLNRDPKVKQASVNFGTETLAVYGLLNKTEICAKVAGLGYKAYSIDTLAQRKALIDKERLRIAAARRRFLWSAALSAPVVAVAMSMAKSRWLHWLQLLLATPVVFGSGKPFFVKALRLAKHRAANMDTLIALGVGSAYVYSLPSFFRRRGHMYFEAAAAIITFVLLGRYLEERAKGKAGEAIRQLVDLQPQTATLIRDNREIIVAIETVAVGDILLIRPGEKIPTDGEIVFGASTVDESMVTGESMPVVKETGHQVIGGCINGSGVLKIRATAVGMDTVLAGIVHMVDQAQSAKLPIQKQVDKISAVFVPAVMGISALTFAGWTAAGAPFALALGNAVTVLLIACPCALGLATPAAIMVGTGQAAKKGIYIRNGESLEIAAKLSVIVFDKTGTITEGKPKVSDFFKLSRLGDEKIVMLAASAENYSEHFLAKAIVDYARECGVEIKECSHFSATAGRGIRAEVDGKQLLLGNLPWLQENDVDAKSLPETARHFAEQGKTPIYMAVNGKEAAVFGIADKPRAQSAGAITRLHRLGVETVMATGDIEKTARYIADKVGIRQLLANAKPEQKLDVIRQLQAEGKQVGMIGDGVNDAPALAAADVGFAIGSGTDIAIESADLTLLHGDISKVTEAIELSTDTIRIIKQNLFWAFGYNTIAIPVAAWGKLNPMLASAAMALSSVSVVLNSLRLSKK
ncbi:MAG: heavy metal translocating P-type ATPase [Gammaproteobacteria bacterium]